MYVLNLTLKDMALVSVSDVLVGAHLAVMSTLSPRKHTWQLCQLWTDRNILQFCQLWLALLVFVEILDDYVHCDRSQMNLWKHISHVCQLWLVSVIPMLTVAGI